MAEDRLSGYLQRMFQYNRFYFSKMQESKNIEEAHCSSDAARFAINRSIYHWNLWQRIDFQGVRNLYFNNRFFTIAVNGESSTADDTGLATIRLSGPGPTLHNLAVRRAGSPEGPSILLLAFFVCSSALAFIFHLSSGLNYFPEREGSGSEQRGVWLGEIRWKIRLKTTPLPGINKRTVARPAWPQATNARPANR